MATSGNESKHDNQGTDNGQGVSNNAEETEHCCICYNKTGLRMFSCTKSHLICFICYNKVGGRCPFCAPIVPLVKSKKMENLNRDKK